MAAVATSSALKLSRKHAELVVLLGDSTGDRPNLTHRVEWLECLSIERSFGTDCTIHLRHTPDSDQRIEDLSLEPVNRIIEVRRYDDNDELTEIVAWGRLRSNPNTLSEDDETIGLVATLDLALFGEVLEGYPVSDRHAAAAATDFQTIDDDIEFNPLDNSDQTVRGNRSRAQNSRGVYLWVAPQSTGKRTEETTQGTAGERWTVPQAVHALCDLLNPGEEYLENPSLTSLEFDAGPAWKDDGELLRAVTIPRGRRLPEALGMLLEPIDWAFELVESVDDQDTDMPANKSTLRIYPRRQAPPKVLKLVHRDDYDDGSSQVGSVDVAYDLIERPNVVIGHGDVEQVEATFVLRPGWSEGDDALTLLAIENGYESQQLYRDVGTKWVLNESGAYSRTDLDVYDFRDLLGSDAAVRRRRFDPCLSLAPDGNPVGENGYLVEWKDPIKKAWVVVQWSFAVLTDECGIQFQSPPPQALWSRFRAIGDDPENPLVRITATVKSDRRLKARADRDTHSPLPTENPVLIDWPDKFRSYKVDTTSTLYAARHEAIEAVTTATTGGSFTIDGDHAAKILRRKSICVIGSTGNDGRYRVSGATLVGTQTVVTVVDAVLDATVDGVVGFETLEESDGARLQARCEQERDKLDGSAVSGSITLIGLDHWDYRVGDSLEQIEGRAISFNRYTAASGDATYPEITRMAWDVRNQSLTMVVE